MVRLLAPAIGESYLDLTVGCGGHAAAIAERIGAGGRIVGVDRDPEALDLARTALEGRGPVLLRGSFGDLRSLRPSLPVPAFDLVLADLGVSSLQLDEGRRGFSFRRDGPLDMRMDFERGPSAAEWVAEVDEGELTRVLREYGEERHARRIADEIVRVRRGRSIRTTGELADIVRGVVPRRRDATIDPATRTFQAIRIAVNGELDALDHLLAHFDPLLRPGGRFAILAYHSLEDRRVKDTFRTRAKEGDHELLTPKPIRPGETEIAANPRARSARLRGIRRFGGPRETGEWA